MCIRDRGWSAPTKLTDNNSVYEFAPDIASDGTNITVAWVENSENDCFALSGTNSIYTKTNGDNWANTTKAATGLGLSLIHIFALDAAASEMFNEAKAVGEEGQYLSLIHICELLLPRS